MAGNRSHPSRQRGYKPTYNNRRFLGHPGWQSVVATKQFVPVIEEVIDLLGREVDDSNQPDSRGGVYALCGRAEKFGVGSESGLARRLYDIRSGKTRAIRANLAEAFLAAGDLRMNEVDVMELPAGPVAARERIEIWLDLNGKELSKTQIDDLAEDLFEFAMLMVHGVEDEEEVEIAA